MTHDGDRFGEGVEHWLHRWWLSHLKPPFVNFSQQLLQEYFPSNTLSCCLQLTAAFAFKELIGKKQASKQANNKQPVSLYLAKGVSSNLETATICLPDFCFCLGYEWATVYDKELENAWHLPSSWQLSGHFLPLSLQYTCVHIHPPINLFLLFSLPESSSRGSTLRNCHRTLKWPWSP